MSPTREATRLERIPATNPVRCAPRLERAAEPPALGSKPRRPSPKSLPSCSETGLRCSRPALADRLQPIVLRLSFQPIFGYAGQAADSYATLADEPPN